MRTVQIARAFRRSASSGSDPRRTARVRLLSRVAALVLLATALVPVFQANVLEPGDQYFFSNWDKESQALVLGNIEMTQRGGPASPWGLQNALPDVQSPYATFDGLQFGQSPTATGYRPYSSSLGLQGRLFDALYAEGCSTLNCLTTVESSLFSFFFVLFVAVLALATRRSFGVVVLICGLVSPWVVSSAHNLYWVPWTWLLPAIAACGLALARSRRARIACVIAVGVGTAVKASTGYEFLTTTTLLAGSIPVLAHVLGTRRSWRLVARDVGAVLAAAVLGFAVVLLVHAFVAGGGSLAAGIAQIVHDALKRTYGSPSLGGDAVTIESLKVTPLRVLVIYLVDWRSTVFSIGVGEPMGSLSLGPGSFWVMVVVAGATIVVDLVRERRRWRRNAVVFAVSALPPISWFVLAKSHSFTATSVNFVLWYVIFIPAVVWIIGSVLADLPVVLGLRALVAPSTASRPSSGDLDEAGSPDAPTDLRR